MVTLSISNSLLGNPNTIVPVDISIDDATGLQAVDFTLQYDTNLLDLVVNDAEGNSSSVTFGSLTASGWTSKANVDETNGKVTVGLFSTERLSGGSGSVIRINFQIKPDVTLNTTTPLDLTSSKLGINGQDVAGGATLSDGALTFTSEPVSRVSLDVDGSGTVSFARDGLLASAFLFFNTNNRTDFSVLDRFVRDPAAVRKTGNAVADFIKQDVAAFDVDGSGGTPSFARDGLLIQAFLFFNTNNRTDFSVLDRFVRDPAAVRKTGNAVADYIKANLLPSTTGGLTADAKDLAPASDIFGTAGGDTLTGDAGNNNLVGGAGDDTLTGGMGSDTFTFASGSGSDVITDFNSGADIISLDASLGFNDGSDIFTALSFKGATDGGFSSELNLGDGDKVTIFHDEALTADNFVVI